MMKLLIINTLNISQPIIIFRLRKLDPFVKIEFVRTLLSMEDLTALKDCVAIESLVLTENDIAAALSLEVSVEEQTALTDYVNSSTNFALLNGWWTWDKDTAVTNVTNAIFAGKTQAQVDADIDALPASVAGMRTGLHTAAAQIIAIRTLLTFVVRAIVFLRDYTIRMRR